MIIVKNISKSFKERVIIDNFSLIIHDGDFLGIIGSSGSGKTTLINLLSLLEESDDGEITINNIVDPTSKERMLLRRNVLGNIFQNYALMENCTIKENLKIAIRYQKKKNYDFKEVLMRVGLEHIDLNTKIYELSGGEQQRIALARVILQDSQYIFADEPTGNLDEENTEKVFNILKELNQEGKTIILVTHDKGLAERCKRIIHL